MGAHLTLVLGVERASNSKEAQLIESLAEDFEKNHRSPCFFLQGHKNRVRRTTSTCKLVTIHRTYMKSEIERYDLILNVTFLLIIDVLLQCCQTRNRWY